jgi:hypothetical protein
LHLKITNKDGDVVEVDWEHREDVFAGIAVAESADAPPGAGADASGAAADRLAGANSEAAAPAGTDSDGRLKQLARLRDWAGQVADEVRKQQKRILEENLKRSAKFQANGDGRFILIHVEAEQSGPAQGDSGADAAGGDSGNGVPEYWNAENTSDRIVNFATQMAQIAGNDSDFAETIVQAVADGFDQANAETGPLPGAAGDLNRKTRELTFSKLSKWLDERKSMGYNQGART